MRCVKNKVKGKGENEDEHVLCEECLDELGGNLLNAFIEEYGPPIGEKLNGN